MDNHEAIASLRTLCHNCKLFPKCAYEKPECFKAIELAISALEAQELSKNSTELDKENGDLQPTCNQLATDTISRQASCDYCHEDTEGYVKPIEKNGHAFVRFGMDGWELNLRAKGWHGSTKIRYCPMCGRELKHE